MSLAIRLRAETLRSLGFASIGATYMGIGSPFLHPIRIFELQNLTDALLLFSFDGINDHIALPAQGFILLDVTANKTITSGFFLAEGDRVYVKESETPTTGSVYVTAFFGQEV